jgi:drug/metabolite transporter (DMT)-like permease
MLANKMLPPAGVAFWRMVFGCVPMGILWFINRRSWPRSGKIWLHLAVVSLTMNAIPGVLFAYAETQVSSALAGIMNAFTPLMTVLMILIAFREEKPNRRVLTGLAVGFSGALVVLGIWNGFGDRANLMGVAAPAIAVLLYGIGGPYARRYVSPAKLPLEVQITAQIGLAALMLLPYYVFGGDLLIGPITWDAVFGTVLLGALGSGIAYVWYYRLMNQAGSAVANSVTYLSPVVAVIAGAAVLGEKVTWNEVVGGAIVILGAAISQGMIPLPNRKQSA